MTSQEENKNVELQEEQSEEKLPYHAPTFVQYGSIANLVQNMEGVGADGATFFTSDTLS